MNERTPPTTSAPATAATAPTAATAATAVPSTAPADPCRCAPAADTAACGCCEGLGPQTPLEVYNRPGLAALAYRVGTQPLFKRSMLDALSPPDPAPPPPPNTPTDARLPMRQLAVRADDDFTIALLDAWAVVADVLTFYQERIANESYLRTATERFSLLQLGRLVGYEPRPGVAASTRLAFTLNQPTAAPAVGIPGLPAIPPTPAAAATFGAVAVTSLDPGIKVQSAPPAGQQAQTFETIEKIDVRPEWNAIRPRLSQPHPADVNLGAITLSGLDGNVKRGDYVLLVAGGKVQVSRVASVESDLVAQTMTLTFESGDAPPASSPAPAAAPDDPPTPAPLPLNAGSVGDVLSRNWRQEDLLAFAAIEKWPLDQLRAAIDQVTAARDNGLTAFVFRGRAALFGHNAPAWASLPDLLRNGQYLYRYDSVGNVSFHWTPAAYPDDWDSRPKQSSAGEVDLDAVYPAVTKGSWVAFRDAAGKVTASMVGAAAEQTVTGFTLTAKATHLTLTGPGSTTPFTLRTTSVLVQAEPLKLGNIPVTDTLTGGGVVLSGAFLELKSGQEVAVTGSRSDLPGVTASEIATIDSATLAGGFTVLRFLKALAYPYDPRTVTINANVAPATHGETRNEILGSGDASQSFQQFTLKQPPLTYVSGDNPNGVVSTLQVRVNDLLWHEVPALFASGPGDRVFITRARDDGTTRVQFGDGVTGARLPSGHDNVTATYRQGIGRAGSVPAGSLSVLLSQPLGVKGVLNPIPAAGGDDPESRDEARRNTPLTLLTLDRVVSLADYQDFAAAFPAVGKALATWTWDGGRRGVLLTVAGPGGAAVDPAADTAVHLARAIAGAGDPSVPLRLVNYRPAPFLLAADVRTDPDYLVDKVRAAIEAALRDAFSFDARSFGQPVFVSEVIAIVQNVPGVVELNLSRLYPSTGAPGLTDLVPEEPKAGADVTGGVLGAQLLTLDPAPLKQLTVTPAA